MKSWKYAEVANSEKTKEVAAIFWGKKQSKIIWHQQNTLEYPCVHSDDIGRVLPIGILGHNNL